MDQHQKAVKAYMSEIGNYGLVTPLQEVELANLIAEGSDAAREMLTHGNLRLVVKIANEYRHLGVPMSDLIAEGNVGLMRAVLKFRGGHGAKFSSYAAWWIKQAIRRCVANQGRIVRVPIQSLSRYRQIREVAAAIESKTGRAANNHEIAAEMKVTPRTVRTTIVNVNTSTSSLDAEIVNGEGGRIGDLVPDTSAADPEEMLERADAMQLLRQIMDEELNEREIAILKMRFGFEDGQAHTLDEVSERFGRTRERVRQIQHHALKKLRLRLKGSELHTLLSENLPLN
ncbi:MAG: hypothetical protein RL095_2506 [Verrucomicrobiota bacterium]|jgi:RNA polymerase primary sigma factor